MEAQHEMTENPLGGGGVAMTAVFVAAASKGDVEEIRSLYALDKIDLNAADSNGRIAMLMAAAKGKTKVVAVLAELGADVNNANEFGCTAVWVAALNGHEDTITALADLGADVKRANHNGETPAQIAAQSSHHGTVKLLEELGGMLAEEAMAAAHTPPPPRVPEASGQLEAPELRVGANVMDRRAEFRTLPQRITDRCMLGLFGWSAIPECVSEICCYLNLSKKTSRSPFKRTFLKPAGFIIDDDPGKVDANVGYAFETCWNSFFLQIFCAVDVVVGPILVNAADCLVSNGCCYFSDPEACCCVYCAGGFKEFDRLHWSLWKCSPLPCLCQNCPCTTCPNISPISDTEWQESTLDTFLGIDPGLLRCISEGIYFCCCNCCEVADENLLRRAATDEQYRRGYASNADEVSFGPGSMGITLRSYYDENGKQRIAGEPLAPIVVVNVVEGGAAYHQGIKRGDLIWSMNGIPLQAGITASMFVDRSRERPVKIGFLRHAEGHSTSGSGGGSFSSSSSHASLSSPPKAATITRAAAAAGTTGLAESCEEGEFEALPSPSPTVTQRINDDNDDDDDDDDDYGAATLAEALSRVVARLNAASGRGDRDTVRRLMRRRAELQQKIKTEQDMPAATMGGTFGDSSAGPPNPKYKFDFRVKGAGVASVNGYYRAVREYIGRQWYNKLDSSGNVIPRDDRVAMHVNIYAVGNDWHITVTGVSGYQYTAPDPNGREKSLFDLPPRSGWVVETDGQGPAPTLEY